jgi:DNA-binding beta-propeller fold protein YncE
MQGMIKRAGHVRRGLASLVMLCVCLVGLAGAAAPASAFRFYQSELTEVPAGAPDPGPFGNALKVATDSSNNVWVLDSGQGYGFPPGKGVVDKFDSSGAFLAQGTGVGGWHPNGGQLRALDFNSLTGLMYVADNTAGDLWKLNANAVVQGSIPGDPNAWHPNAGFDCCGMQVDIDNTAGPGKGNIYVSATSCCSSDYQGIYRINPSGQPVPFPTSASNVEGNHITGTTNRQEDNISPSGVAIAADGDIWAAVTGSFSSDARGLIHFDSTGEFLETIEDFPISEGEGFFLTDIAIDPTNGHILLVNQRSEGSEVWEFRPDGSFIESLTPATPFAEPTGIAVDGNGKLYVADRGSVKVFGRDFPLPEITYGPATDQTQTGGTLHASVGPGEGTPITTCTVEYGTDTSYGSSAACSPDPASSPPGSNFTGPTQVSVALSGLTSEQDYHYRFVVGNADATRTGEDRVFVPHWVVGLDTTAATELAPSSAKLNGAFNGNGKHTTYHFEWGKDSSYGNTTPEQDAGSPSGAATVQSTLAGLAPVTTYHYRVVATSPDGVSNGDDEVFTTPPLAPTLTQWVTDVHSDSVVFHAKVNPGGGPTTYQVEYVDDAAFQISGFGGAALAPSTPGKVGHEFKPVEVTATVATLTPGTTYHYRVTVSNSYKTVVGAPRTFTTFEYGGALKDPCPNSQVRQQTGAALLFECRAFELVSAGNTAGYDVESEIIPGQDPFSGYPLASGPSRVLYGVHQGAIPGDWNPTNLGLDPYVATRGDDGWTTQYVGLSADETPSLHPFASTFSGADQQLGMVAFSGGDLCAPCFKDGSSGIPIRMPDGAVVQGMAGSLDPGPTAKPDILVRKRLSGDGSHLVFGSTSKFEGDADAGNPSIYSRDLHAGTTEVVSKLANGQNIPCLLNCASNGVAELDLSTDGSRVLVGQLVSTDSEGNDYWHLYMNVGGASQGIDLMPGSTSGGLYDGMSADGSKVYFTTRDKLSSDTDSSADVYRAEVGDASSTLSRVSTGSGGAGDTDACDPALNNTRPRWNTIGAAANCDAVAVAGGGGVSSESGDIYFLSPEQLDGSDGTAGAPNLYLARVGSSPEYVTTLESSLVVPQPAPTGHPFVRSFGDMEAPKGIAYDPSGDYVYVLDPGLFSGNVYKFDSRAHPVNFTAGSEAGGNVLTGADTPSGAFQEYGPLGLPNELAVDYATGDFFVPNVLGGGVERFSETGEFLSRIPVGFSTAVAVDQDNGDVYVTTFFGTVNVYDSSGASITSFPTIESPVSVAVDSAGNVYVANGVEAVMYDSTGTFVRKLDTVVAKGVAVDPSNDHVYVAEGARIREFDPAGNPLSVTGEGRLVNSTALVADDDRIIATDSEAGTVLVWGKSGVLPDPLYDNPLVLNAIGDTEVHRPADFQTTSTGDFAAFSSQLPLTGYDSDGHVEVFRFGANGDGIDCASCAATGARATGDAGLPPRGLGISEAGSVFFNSTDPLIPSDLNGAKDVFQWLNGKIGPISSGTSAQPSSLLSITADGTDAYFFTRETLAPQDENGNSVKIYDARVQGGFHFQPSPPPCKASDECHGPGTVAAPPPDIGTYVGTGGNEKPQKKKKTKKKRRKHRPHKHKRHHSKGKGGRR